MERCPPPGRGIVVLISFLYGVVFTLSAHPSVPPLPRMESNRIRTPRKTYGTIYHLYHLLLYLHICHGASPHATFHEQHCGGSFGSTDSLCPHQRLVEDFHPHSSRWRFGRCPLCLLLLSRFQSCLVVLHHIPHRRYRRHQPHDTAPAFPLTSCSRFLGRCILLSHSHTLYLIEN